MRVPELFALARGVACTGPHRCYYCAAACDGSRPAADHVTATFTGAAEVPCPDSPSVCEGCVLCLADAADITQIDGASGRVAKNAMRSFSWVVTRHAATAATKAHLAQFSFTYNVPGFVRREPAPSAYAVDCGRMSLGLPRL